MEDLSQVAESVRLPVRIGVHPFLMDHCVEEKVVLSAVEAMQVLAASVKELKPDADVDCMVRVTFEKFLYVEPGRKEIAAISQIGFHKNGDITAKLLTRTKSKKASITRVKEHASLCFPRDGRETRVLPLDVASALEGVVLAVPAQKIYRDLVPFGPAYRNIIGTLRISEDGGIAPVRAPVEPVGRALPRLLGSPFPLDAAFHAACVWGQRFAGFVAFPIAFDKRMIFKRLRAGEDYLARIIPVRRKPDLLVFDVWIYDAKGELFEAVSGVVMKDVTAGRMKPPRWILADGPGDRPGSGPRNHHHLSMIELDTVMPFSERALSQMELNRCKEMGAKRRRSYLAARLASKRLARKLSENDLDTPAAAITTVDSDGVRPACPVKEGSEPFCCAASHDSRFAVAVASERRVGVDVERISERVLRSQDLFMVEDERALVEVSSLGRMACSLRVWSTKEAVCKALNMTLAESWRRARVTQVGRDESHVRIDDKDDYVASHCAIDEHLITIIEIE